MIYGNANKPRPRAMYSLMLQNYMYTELYWNAYWNTELQKYTELYECLHNYHQYITFDTQDTLWQTLYIDKDHVQITPSANI